MNDISNVNITIILLMMITLCMNGVFFFSFWGDSRIFSSSVFGGFKDFFLLQILGYSRVFFLQILGDSRVLFFYLRFWGILGFFLFQILGDSRFFFFFRFWGILGGLFAVGIIMIAVTYVICRFRSPNSCSKLYYGLMRFFVAWNLWIWKFISTMT